MHIEIARLVEQAGPGVLDDADSFRAALDDFLAEDAATRGELNLLVDAVRLGTFARLLNQVEHGAEIAQATRILGRELARDRGTTESASASWALGVLAFAVGKLDEPALAELRVAMVPEGPAAQVAGRPAEARADDAVLASTTVKRPSTVPLDEDAEPGSSRRTGRILLAVGAVVVLLVGGLAFASGWGRGDDDPSSDGSSPTTTTPAADFTPLAIPGGAEKSRGVRRERTYRLAATRFSSTVVLTNTTKAALTLLWAEVVPKQLAEHVNRAKFVPTTKKTLVSDESDPIVYWRLTIAAGQTREVRWSTPLPDGAMASEDYLARITGWHEQAVDAGQSFIDRELPKRASSDELVLTGDKPDPVLPTDEGSVTPTTDNPDEPKESPTAVPDLNDNPRLTIDSVRMVEETQKSVSLRVTDADGDDWSITSVSGFPGAQHTAKGLTLRTTHSTSQETSNWRYPKTSRFTVRVSISDGHGGKASDTFSLTVTDDHRLMPNYEGTPGTNQHLIVRGSARSFCYDSDLRAGDSIIIGQSVKANTIIKWGATVRYDWASNPAINSGDPAC